MVGQRYIGAPATEDNSKPPPEDQVMVGMVSGSLTEATVRMTITPMVDDYINCLKTAALRMSDERQITHGRAEARLRNRLDTFAGVHGIFGQQRAALNMIVDTVLNERATAALKAISQEMNSSERKRPGWGGWMMAAAVFLIVF